MEEGSSLFRLLFWFKWKKKLLKVIIYKLVNKAVFI